MKSFVQRQDNSFERVFICFLAFPSIKTAREFSGGSVVKTQVFHGRGPRFNPRAGQAEQHRQKKKKKKKKNPQKAAEPLEIHQLREDM